MFKVWGSFACYIQQCVLCWGCTKSKWRKQYAIIIIIIIIICTVSFPKPNFCLTAPRELLCHYCGDSGSGSSCHTSLSFSFAFCALFAAFHSVTKATRSQTAKQGVSSRCGAAGSTTNRPLHARMAGRVTDRPADSQQGCLIGRPPCWHITLEYSVSGSRDQKGKLSRIASPR